MISYLAIMLMKDRNNYREHNYREVMTVMIIYSCITIHACMGAQI